jgi:uncharacterized protein
MGVLRPQDPLIDRIASGRTDLVFDFVSAGQPATFVDAGGATLISWCSYYGDVSAIRFLLSQGERLASLGPNLGLDSAAFHGHWQLCEFLLESGAQANFETGGFMRDCRTKGETALHRAAAFASDETVQRLLDAGATVDARDMNGDTPLGWASW